MCAHIERECVCMPHIWGGGGGGCIYREGQCVHIWRGRVCVCMAHIDGGVHKDAVCGHIEREGVCI